MMNAHEVGLALAEPWALRDGLGAVIEGLAALDGAAAAVWAGAYGGGRVVESLRAGSAPRAAAGLLEAGAPLEVDGGGAVETASADVHDSAILGEGDGVVPGGAGSDASPGSGGVRAVAPLPVGGSEADGRATSQAEGGARRVQVSGGPDRLDRVRAEDLAGTGEAWSGANSDAPSRSRDAGTGAGRGLEGSRETLAGVAGAAEATAWRGEAGEGSPGGRSPAVASTGRGAGVGLPRSGGRSRGAGDGFAQGTELEGGSFGASGLERIAERGVAPVARETRDEASMPDDLAEGGGVEVLQAAVAPWRQDVGSGGGSSGRRRSAAGHEAGMAAPFSEETAGQERGGGSSRGDTAPVLELDGRVIGQWLNERMAREAGRPATGTTFFDPRQAPAWSPSGSL